MAVPRPAASAAPGEHTLKIRDLRLRVDAPELYVAQCSCGWQGEEHRGAMGARSARQEGRRHAEAERMARNAKL